MTHRISIIDTRHQTITYPYIQKGITFKKVLCQYTIFEQKVCFTGCVFEGDILFGDEDIDEAYSVVKSDLIFENCIFKKKVKLDGLQCAGHVVFKGGCQFVFDGGTTKAEYALSLSNATIGLGVSLQNATFNSGINLSATHINQVGCQFYNVKLNNSYSNINFCSSYMGKEFSINASNIICSCINFEAVSVDDSQGTMQFKGRYIGNKDDQTITTELIKSNFNIEISSYKKIVSIYRIIDDPNSPLLLVKENDEEEYSPKILLNLFRSAVNIETDIKVVYYDQSGLENDGLTPLGDIALLSDTKEELSYLSIMFQGKTSIVDLKNMQINQLELKKFAQFVFSNMIDVDASTLSYHIRSHRSVPMIYAMSSIDDWSRDVYIAIYDLNHNYKIYKWNYIKCLTPIVLSQTHIGRGLYINQSEFDVPKIDIHALSAQHEIKFEDIVFNLYNINISQTKTTNLRFHNIDFVYNDETKKDYFVNNPDEWNYYGINFDYSNISNKLFLEGITASNYGSTFSIKANFLTVKNVLSLRDIRHDNHTSLLIEIKGAQLNQLNLNQIEWDNTEIETENVGYKDLELDGKSPKFEQIKQKTKSGNFVGSINSTEGRLIKTYPIHFLKQMDAIFEKYDRTEDQRNLWMMRNRMRIWRDNNKCVAIIKILNNELVLNYGWSPWRIVIWLTALIAIFDTITCQCFGMELYTSIVNGFVEFVPVSFNEPIVEQLHGVNPQDPKYGPPLLSLEYSALVTGYRLLSYTLLSVLIAAWSGYFRKKNQ